MAKRLSIVLVMLWIVPAAFALIGTPCDPETDFSERYLVSHWKSLPHKNQEETAARCDQVNAKAGKPIWKYDPTPNTPLYACLSYGASTMADWWAQELGWKLPTYVSYTNGSVEQGFNPRKLEVRYRKRAKWNLLVYAMARWTDHDPITGEPVPIRPKGYARLLTDDDEETLGDKIDGRSFAYKATDYPMEGDWFAVVSKNWNRDSVEAKLKQAVRDYGPLYVQFEIPGKHYLFGTHAPVVIGYGKLPSGKTVFICHDSFGNFPKTKKQDGEGAAAYRYVSAEEIDEAIVFPHRPVATCVAVVGGKGIRFANRAGRPLAVRRAFYRNRAGKTMPLTMLSRQLGWIADADLPAGKVMVYVEVDYYMAKGGKGHWLSVPLTPVGP